MLARNRGAPLISILPDIDIDIDSAEPGQLPRIGPLRSAIGRLGASIIYALIWIFGRRRRRAEVAWLAGPVGGDVIGDAPYRDVVQSEGLVVERTARAGGLVPDFAALRGPGFDPGAIHPLIRDFYEHTADFTMDVWSQTYFPTSIGLALLVMGVGSAGAFAAYLAARRAR